MKDKIDFIINELWTLAWAASVQRAKLYAKRADSASSAAAIIQFRESVIKFLADKIVPTYAEGCAEELHYTNIEDLIDYANLVNSGVLGEAGYKYGVAQKLLNLALKYYWCLGFIAEPPHCPIDRIIISKTRYNGRINWTQILRRDEYEEVIKEVKALAQAEGLSISQWELVHFRPRQPVTGVVLATGLADENVFLSSPHHNPKARR
ncbi:MAG TPA: hypothetical protein PKZ40_06420 [Anaerolineaceae bacterium]|jgi:hypothetical protein|nr:hypothetical protein [Anaerolineaceae bacterium]HPK27356.1 hypothetical protein [Anaerolineaceae bacterium]